MTSTHDDNDVMVHPATDDCPLCEHDMGAHEMRGYPDAQLRVPVGGWVNCSECECLTTWVFPADGVREIRAKYSDDPRLLRVQCPECAGRECRVELWTGTYDPVVWTCLGCDHEFVT